jgi:hypothetical protein
MTRRKDRYQPRAASASQRNLLRTIAATASMSFGPRGGGTKHRANKRCSPVHRAERARDAR